MTQKAHADRLLYLCLMATCVAILLTAVVVRADLQPTTFNAIIDGARFVTAVAAVWFGSIVIFERRLARSAVRPKPAAKPHDTVVIDLREVDLTKTSGRPSRPAATIDTDADLANR